MIDAERRDEAVVLRVEGGRDRRRDEPRGRLKQLKLDAVGIGPHAQPAGAANPGKAGGFELLRHAGAVVDLRERAVVSDRRHPPRCSRADRDVADLPIRRQIAQQDEVAQRVAHRLLMQPGLEDPHVELRRRRGIGNDDVEVFEAQVVERQRRRGRLRQRESARDGVHAAAPIAVRKVRRDGMTSESGPISVISPPGSLSLPREPI